MKMQSTGLFLTGGGARAAYQAGVLKAVSEFTESSQPRRVLFGQIAGVSAGAINAAALASSKSSFALATQHLVKIWSNLTPSDIYCTDIFSMSKIAGHWIRNISVGALLENRKASELLSTAPLKLLLEKEIDFKQIENNIREGELESITCAAFSYNQQRTVSFVSSIKDIKLWSAPKRYSIHVPLAAKHVLASCAIPILFPPVKIEKEYYGDGSLRNTAPISPLLHLGANKILIIGVRTLSTSTVCEFKGKPSIGQMAGIILNGIFFDSTDVDVDVDVERLGHINEILSERHPVTPNAMRQVEVMWVRPSVDLGAIARDLDSNGLPKTIRYLLGGLGEKNEIGELESYLMFHHVYTKKLIEIGYSDGMSLKNQLLDFLAI